jgi:predicted metal-dependent hydrolase
MSHKRSKVSEVAEPLRGGELDARYLGYFDCFNRQLYFEAHEVLEQLWLKERRGPNDLFYKGLIQLAGAFVHLQKQREQPAAALFRLARTNLSKYAPRYEQLDISEILLLIEGWLGELDQTQPAAKRLTIQNAPRLSLIPQAATNAG